MVSKKLIAGGVVLLVIGISWFTILKRATDNETVQTNTMYVEEGGTGYLVPQQEQQEKDKLDISYQPGIEYNGESGMTYKFGVSFKW